MHKAASVFLTYTGVFMRALDKLMGRSSILLKPTVPAGHLRRQNHLKPAVLQMPQKVPFTVYKEILVLKLPTQRHLQSKGERQHPYRAAAHRAH
jgi:hypothetical protein